MTVHEPTPLEHSVAIAARSRDPARRCAAAEQVLHSDDLAVQERVLARLAQDPIAAVREAATRSLSRLLARASGLASVRIVATWALNQRTNVRAAVARALRGARDTVGARTAIERLALDDDPVVRRAAWVTLARWRDARRAM